ncbi:hypothetical protein BJX64DRAFT_283167 [Aspergillus heterothallicus]
MCYALNHHEKFTSGRDGRLRYEHRLVAPKDDSAANTDESDTQSDSGSDSQQSIDLQPETRAEHRYGGYEGDDKTEQETSDIDDSEDSDLNYYNHSAPLCRYVDPYSAVQSQIKLRPVRASGPVFQCVQSHSGDLYQELGIPSALCSVRVWVWIKPGQDSEHDSRQATRADLCSATQVTRRGEVARGFWIRPLDGALMVGTGEVEGIIYDRIVYFGHVVFTSRPNFS